MTTLASIRKQIADLEKKAQQLIKAEAAQAIAKVKELIERYGLTPEDLGWGAGKRGKKATRGAATRNAKSTSKAGSSAGVPMYQDPASGKTWTGRGKPPAWIAGASDRSAFLMSAQPAAADTPAKAPKAAKAARKKARAATAKASPEAAKPAKAAQPAKGPKAPRVAAKKAAGKKAAQPKPAATASEPAPAASDTPAS
jgi:DNA-binding protein H-NS